MSTLRVDKISPYQSSSILIEGDVVQPNAATTGSNTFVGNQTVNGDLNVTGTLTATQYVVSSSVSHITTSFSSGSTIFGDSVDDTHQITGSLLFSGSNDAQTLAYAGGVGHMMMVDTNRTDVYTELGTTDKPFKTLSAAITAANAANPTGTDPYTFVMMGCNIDENISFNGTAFNFITLATSCRTVINGTLTITDNPNLKQLIIRNLEFAQPVTITGDGTTAQMNDLSFYNTSFADTLNVTCANSLALWDVYSSAAVNLTNLHYLYVGGGQIIGDVTIVADSTQTLPSEGMSPGQAIVFDLICNNLTFTRGGSATYVFQPHNTRIGLNAGSYTIPTGFTVSAQASTFRGTWTNNGSLTLRNSSTDNAVAGTQPTYTGRIGGNVLATSVVVSGSLLVSGSAGLTGALTASVFTGSFIGDGSGLTGIPGVTPIETGSFATTGSNTFIGDQIVTGSVTISGSISQIGVGNRNIIIRELPQTNLTTGEYNTIIGAESGILLTEGASNTFIGDNAGALNVIGNDNVFVGRFTGYRNKASQNTFVGSTSGFSNTQGTYNAFFGHYAGYNNSVASNNTFIGQSTGFDNTSGSGNTFVGRGAGENNTIANNNAFVGYNAGRDNSVGTNNAFFGTFAGQVNISGSSNTFIGDSAGVANTQASDNTFVGQNAGSNNSVGTDNAFVGKNAGTNNTSGSGNSFFGRQAAAQNNTGANNSTFGFQAGQFNQSGSSNTFFGKDAGTFLGNGSSQNDSADNSVFLGAQTRANASAETNQIVIGYQAVGNGSDTVTIGNSSITDTYLKGVVSTTTTFRMPSYTDVQTGSLTPQNGDMIYNTTVNKFVGYANGAWVELH